MIRNIFPLVLCAFFQWNGVNPSLADSTTRSNKSEIYDLGDERFRVRIEISPNELVDEFGPRFDLTARVSSIVASGTSFLGSYGLVDEFGLKGIGVLGFAQAPLGGTFIKVGVGRLTRPGPEPYHFNTRYPVVQFFPTTVREANALRVVVEQVGGNTGSFAYRYTKRYDVEPKASALCVHYELTNTGTNDFVFEHYNHHWFLINGVPMGATYTFQSAFPLVPAELRDWRRLGAALVLRQAVLATVGYHDQMTRIPKVLNLFFIGLRGTGPLIESKGDYEATEFALYAVSKGLCPELFYRASLRTGETASWSRNYLFHAERKDRP